MRFVALALATALGVGYMPLAPGTFGSLVGLALWWILPASVPVQITTIVVLFILGSWSGSVAERHFQREDPGQVVLDEVIGLLITMVLAARSWPMAIGGFLLFRLFDIVKPYPVNRCEQLPGGFGIMADDAVAGVYANLALHGGAVLISWLASQGARA